MSTIHTVRKNETLSSIARRYSCDPKRLQQDNGIKDPKKLAEGATLKIPDIRQPSDATRPASKKDDPAKAREPVEGKNWSKELWGKLVGESEVIATKTIRIGHGLSDTVTQWLREIESLEIVHHKEKSKTEPRKPDEKKRTEKAPRPPDSSPDDLKSKPAPRKHRDEVLLLLRDRLYATPHVVKTSGVKLSRNERKMIVAAVGLCEIGRDVFGSENSDTEFTGRKFGRKGIETGYSRIVHIGLSYGYIQWTQDGGGLGRLLRRMQSCVKREEFESFFPNYQQLLQLTSDGLPGVEYNRFGKCGQTYWNSLNKAQKEALQQRANTDANKDNKPDNPLGPSEEIRGARVQKIPYAPNFPAIELWEDYKERPKLNDQVCDYVGYASAFKVAGDVPAFQDAQLDLAVEDYFNPVLYHCKAWNIRSAVGLAMVLAGAVRGGPSPKGSLVTLFSRVGKELFNLADRFETKEQELATLKAMANASIVEVESKGKKAKVGSVTFSPDEKRRAGIILKDEFDFLIEDYYDLNTYDSANDK